MPIVELDIGISATITVCFDNNLFLLHSVAGEVQRTSFNGVISVTAVTYRRMI
jgi:hypothetical protein